MGKETPVKLAELDELLFTGTEIKYTGTNPDHLRTKQCIEVFTVWLRQLRQQKKLTDDSLLTLARAIRIAGMDFIDKKRYQPFRFGSRLEAELEDQLHIKDKNDLSVRERFIYISKLYWFLQNSPESKIKSDFFVEAALKKITQKLNQEIQALTQMMPAEATLDANLINLEARYRDGKQKQHKDPNPERVFLAEFSKALVAVANKEMHGNNPVETLFNLNGRSHDLKIGASIFNMLAVRDGKAPYILRNAYGNSVYYTINADDTIDLRKIDKAIQYQSLATFLDCISSFQIKQKIYEYAKMHQFKSEQFEHIDAGLRPYLSLVENHLKSIEGYGTSIFPTWTITLSLVGAMLLAPVGHGIGAAVGQTITKHDMMVGVLNSLSGITKRLMEATVGPMGHGMAREITQVVVGHINAYGLGTLTQAAFMTSGAAAGAALGAGFDLSIDAMNAFRKQYQIPSTISDKDIEFVLYLIKLPPQILADEVKKRIEYNTNGSRFFQSQSSAPVPSQAPEESPNPANYL